MKTTPTAPASEDTNHHEDNIQSSTDTSYNQPVIDVIGNTLWILGGDTSIEQEDTITINELPQPLPIEWVEDTNATLSEILTGFNLIENGKFDDRGMASSRLWKIETGEMSTAGIDLSLEWKVDIGHTAYLLAAEDAPRPSFTTEQNISVIADTEYKFSGYFASQRADGCIEIICYDKNDEIIDKERIFVPHRTEYSGGTSLERYEFIESAFTPIQNTKYLKVNIQLGKQVDSSQQNGYFFFTDLFLGISDQISTPLAQTDKSTKMVKQLQAELKNTEGQCGRVKLPILTKYSQLTAKFRNTTYNLDLDLELFKHIEDSMLNHTGFNNPRVGAFHIDTAMAIDSVGVLLYGWSYFYPGKLKSILLHGPETVINFTDQLFRTSRLDLKVFAENRTFPDITEFAGFISCIPIRIKTGSKYFVELVFDSGQSEFANISLAQKPTSEIELIRNILDQIPNANRITSQLYNLFDNHLGKAIESVNKSRLTKKPIIEQKQFGISPEKPIASVIVPLYGRYDFMRHQLAHFVNDAEFDNVDLIYIVDDPSITVATLESAIACYSLFEKPFRVAWYDKNLGFAGANNMGVSIAQSEVLLLLNSDVIPKHSGWLGRMISQLETLPKAGAIGPLLLFADDSVQHAGMTPKRDAYYPNFLLNTHPGKGLPWLKKDKPSKHPILTAACLMVRKSDYLDVGGLDEGYIFGDFEDSDFCLKLRKKGLDLWLVPEAKLWHLERQSQNLGTISGYRQLITLFNGWRYHQKILEGEIANPEEGEF